MPQQSTVSIKQKVPWLLLDTGTLLTLLLSDEETPNNHSLAKLGIILDLAKTGQVKIGIPDMVLSEFLGLYAPITQDKLAKIMDSDLSEYAGKLPLGFPKRLERLQFLRHLYVDNNLTVFNTRAGQDYIENLTNVIKQQAIITPEDNEACIANKTAIIDKYENTLRTKRKAEKNEELPEWNDLKPKHVQRLLMENGNMLAQMAKRSGLRNDRGEISIADAITQIRKITHEQAAIFVIYEGSDVRGRVIQRLHHPEDAQQNYLPKAHFNPKNYSKFDEKTVEKMSDVAFVTTRGFLVGLMQAAAQNNSYLFDPNEQNSENAEKIYQQMIENVRIYGLQRVYDDFRDITASQIKAHGESADDLPWQKFVSAQENAFYQAEDVESLQQNIKKIIDKTRTQHSSYRGKTARKYLERGAAIIENELNEVVGQGEAQDLRSVLERIKKSLNQNADELQR